MGLFIAIGVGAMVIVVGAVGFDRRNEWKARERRRDARAMRAYARARRLEANAYIAGIDRRTARFTLEGLAAAQRRMVASGQRSSAQDLRARADAIDAEVWPNVKSA